MSRKKYDWDHEGAIAARERVSTIIDAIDADDLVVAIKNAPSLRGMILGYIAEIMFERHLPAHYDVILEEHIESHDDHDRKANKSDRTLSYNGKPVGIQLKSIQTNSIAYDPSVHKLRATVQNDGSDKRDVLLPDGSSVTTTCYRVGDYDILAVPLFPFTGKWEFAYKTNDSCRRSTSKKYTSVQQAELLATTEIITWPLDNDWTTNLMDIIEPHSIVEVE